MQTIVTESRSVVAWRWDGKGVEKGRGKGDYRKTRGSFRGNRYVHYVLIIVMVLHVYTNVKTYQIVCFKHVELVVCQLYLE